MRLKNSIFTIAWASVLMLMLMLHDGEKLQELDGQYVWKTTFKN